MLQIWKVLIQNSHLFAKSENMTNKYKILTKLKSFISL